MALIKCPKCEQEISDRGEICPYCRTWLKENHSTQETQNTTDFNTCTQNISNSKNTNRFTTNFLIVLLIIGVIFFISKCSNGSTETYSATCTACNETYSYEGHEYGGLASRNVKCIRMTNLCKDCYEIYCWSVGKTPTDY